MIPVLAVKIMKLLPFDKFEITCSRKPKQLYGSIDKQLEPSMLVFKKKDYKPFWGDREGSKFKLHRTIKYQNPFLPIAVGSIEATELGSKIKIKLRMHLLTIVIMSILLSVSLVKSIIEISKSHGNMHLGPIVGFCIGYFLMQGIFWAEVPMIKSLIETDIAGIS